MLRTLFAAAAVYICGIPALDQVRPTFLDKPIEAFYVEVNRAAQDGRHALAPLADGRAMHYLKAYIANVKAHLHSGK
jgi:hypothetical protein